MGDCQTLVMGKTHVSPPMLLSPFVSSNLVNLFNASAGGWGVMAEWLREFIAGEKVGKEASNSSIFPTTPFSPWSVVFTSCCLLSWESVLPHAEVCSSSLWPVDSRTEREAIFPSRPGWNPHAKIGYVFPVYFSVGCELFLTHRLLRSIFP